MDDYTGEAQSMQARNMKRVHNFSHYLKEVDLLEDTSRLS
jgi:hypothetical protein